MKAIDSVLKSRALELLQQNCSIKEIAKRTGIKYYTIEDWSIDWRKQGLLKQYLRAGMEYSKLAKSMCNGLYPVIRKKYLSMGYNDKLYGRECNITNPVEAVGYYLDEKGNPRSCTYCGKFPDKGKVWGLDRLDSNLGHIHGNVVPCCGTHAESAKLSCQLSKSKFTLFSWVEVNLSRFYGHPVDKKFVTKKVDEYIKIALELEEYSKSLALRVKQEEPNHV